MILAFGVKEFVYFGSKKLSGSINPPRSPKFIPNLHELRSRGGSRLSKYAELGRF